MRFAIAGRDRRVLRVLKTFPDQTHRMAVRAGEHALAVLGAGHNWLAVTNLRR